MNKINIQPINKIDSDFYIPGSKSITNRALIISALSDGKTVLKNALFSDDTIYMQSALKSLGFKIMSNESQNEITILGTKGHFSLSNNEIFIGNAGTAMRFLTSFLTLGSGNVIITGNERMQERPIKDLVDSLNSLGANVTYGKKTGYPPLIINSNKLKGGKTRISGKISSQYISSLILIGAFTKQGIDIEIIDDLVSKPYIDITSSIMKDFGIEISNLDYKYLKVQPNQTYRHREYLIEGDASNASYFFAMPAITGGRVRVYNIDNNTKQGDIHFLNVLSKMGCSVEYGHNFVEVIGPAKKGIEIDMRDMSDVVQTLAVLALFVEGKTIIKNVENMRVKETDRIHALYNELTKLGAEVEELQDGLVITPKQKYFPAEIETYDDHRMAMSFSLAGLKSKGITIIDPNCVSKTFPDYFKLFHKIYEN